MNIDRNNYEEYFLLYADNELTDSEKAALLMFVKQNKDLEEEFRMIHYTISRPDVSIRLEDKSFLFKGTPELFINEKNAEEVFVLYHDNELTEKEKLETEEFLSSHPQLKKDFDLIGLARLTPEASVIFPGKKQLYKKEKPGKVVPVMVWRMLAAAVFVGFGIWATQLYFPEPQRLPAETTKTIPGSETAPVIKKNVLPGKKPVNNIVQLPTRNSQSRPADAISAKEKIQRSVSEKNANTGALVNAPVKTPEPQQANPISESPEQISIEEKVNNEVVVAGGKAKNIPEEQIEGDTKMEPSMELAQNTIPAYENMLPEPGAKSVSYVQDANDNNGQNYVFYDITTEEFRKSKVGGFLKKVKRVIERNNPISRLLSGEEKQVVAN